MHDNTTVPLQVNTTTTYLPMDYRHADYGGCPCCGQCPRCGRFAGPFYWWNPPYRVTFGSIEHDAAKDPAEWIAKAQELIENWKQKTEADEAGKD